MNLEETLDRYLVPFLDAPRLALMATEDPKLLGCDIGDRHRLVGFRLQPGEKEA